MELKDKIKDFGLNKSEEYLLKLLDDVVELGELLVADTANPFDDMALNTLKMFKGEVAKLIDRLDGVEG